MTAPRDAPAIDLGGGFAYTPGSGADSAVSVPVIGDRFWSGLMSTLSLDARDETMLASWMRRWGLAPAHGTRSGNQVHGTRVLHATPTPPVKKTDADGIWTAAAGVGLVVRAADCAPVWLADSRSRRLALVHAGWRGVAGGIIESALAAIAPAGLKTVSVAVGPHLQACCFEVGPEVAQHFDAASGAILPPARLTVQRRRPDSVALNLSAAIAATCRRLGIAAAAMRIATACTHCRPELFHSYRRNGTGGPLMAAVGMIRQ